MVILFRPSLLLTIPQYSSVLRLPLAGIVSKAFQDPNYERPKPFNYEDSKYTQFHMTFDKTTFRFDENTKIIIVDGPIGAGKRQLAKELADGFGMHFIPDRTLEEGYISATGYNLRQLDPQLPQSYKSFVMEDFLKNPHDSRVHRMQHGFFHLRLVAYYDALMHVLNTGQGVVMNRSVYSNFVFVEAMIKSRLLNRNYREYYGEMTQAILPTLMRPHLIVYLDTPYEVCMQRIRERNLPYEINSSFLTPALFKHMEHLYKNEYLPLMGKHAELLVYNWSEKCDSEEVIEDIERIKFLDLRHKRVKAGDWSLQYEGLYGRKRMMYTSRRHLTTSYVYSIVPFDVPELIQREEDDNTEAKKIYDSVPDNQYALGFNPMLGDQTLFKLGTDPKHSRLIPY